MAKPKYTTPVYEVKFSRIFSRFDAYFTRVRQFMHPAIMDDKQRKFLLAIDVNDAAYGSQMRSYVATTIAIQMVKARLLLMLAAREEDYVRFYIKPRSTHYFITTWPILDEVRFKEMYRFDREGFEMIVNAVECMMIRIPPHGLATLPNRYIAPYQRVAIALRMLTSGDSSASIANEFGVSNNTVIRCTWMFCEAVNCILKPLFLRWPSEEEKEIVKSDFCSIWGMPNCIGAIDCTHINIECPDSVYARDYRDRSQNFSLQVQAVVDSTMKFTDVVTGWCGSVHDSRIFSYSAIFENKSEYFNERSAVRVNGITVHEYIVGDAGYPLSPNLIIPIRRKKAANPPEKGFNFRHSSTRMCVERAFGRLKSTFKILKGTYERPNMDRFPHIIMACTVLHNIHLHLYGDEDVDDNEDDENAGRYWRYSVAADNRGARLNREAKAIRQTLVTYLYNLPRKERGMY